MPSPRAGHEKFLGVDEFGFSKEHTNQVRINDDITRQ
jgi:hypothetical protein